MSNSLFELEDKTVVITGAAQGIGRGCAEVFADVGANIVVADLQDDKAEHFAAELRNSGTRAISVGIDVREQDGIDKLIDCTLSEFGALDVAVNNAGGDMGYVNPRAELSIFDVDRDYFDACMELNIKATLFCCQAFARAMIEGAGGSIVNITSFQGYRASPGMPVYGAAKAAIAHLTKTLAYELGPYGIRVNSVAPAYAESDRTRALAPERKIAAAEAMPVRRTGRPRDIAAAVVFLASPLASYYTGHHVAADGGLSLTSARPPILWTQRGRPAGTGGSR